MVMLNGKSIVSVVRQVTIESFDAELNQRSTTAQQSVNAIALVQLAINIIS